MATIAVTLSGTPGSLTQWSPPFNCIFIDKIEIWGAGGSGQKVTTLRCTGGGGGAYNLINGPVLTSSLIVSGTIPFTIAAGGTAVTTSSTSNNGVAGGDSWFSDITVYKAVGGGGGQQAASGTATGGVGGAAASCIPSANARSGGNGGTSTVTTGASGGGSSATPTAAGVAGTAVTTAVGGTGGSASGGGAGGAANTNGTANANGGGGGGGGITTSDSGSGGAPGGGGGAHNNATGNSGAGAAGQIIITYTESAPFTSQIHIGLSAWVLNTAYTVGQRISNSTAPIRAYQCITAGTSQNSAGQGPKTTSASISDGTAVWKYLSDIDYTSFQSHYDAVPNPKTVNYVAEIWNDGVITGSPSTFNSARTSDAFTLTYKCAPGESFRDYIPNQALASQNLARNATAGVTFQFPNSVNSVNYFWIDAPGVIFDGIQFYDPNTASASTILYFVQAGTARNCLFDGTSQASAPLVSFLAGSTNKFYNNLLIDRQGASATDFAVKFDSTATGGSVVNNTFAGVNDTNGICLLSNTSGASSVLFRNNITMGFKIGPVVSSPANSITADHNVISASVLDQFTSSIDNGSNTYSTTAANTFSGGGLSGPYQKKTTSAAVNAGQTDTTNVPEANDILRRVRGIGGSWDIGADEVITASVINIPTLQTVVTATRSYDVVSIGAPVTRSSSAYYFDMNGTLRQAATDVLRNTWNPTTLANLGPLLEAASTNLIPNPRAEGSTNGTPGTAPTGWTRSGTSAAIVGTGTEAGIPYIDLLFDDTAAAGKIWIVGFSSLTACAAVNGDARRSTAYIKIVSGSISGFSLGNIEARQYNSSSVNVGTNVTASILSVKSTGNLADQRFGVSITCNNVATASVQTTVKLQTTAGTSRTVTLRIGGLQQEAGLVETSVILPAVGSPAQTTRAADVYGSGIPTLRASGTADQVSGNSASGLATISIISAVSTARLEQTASGLATITSLSAVGSAGQSNLTTGLATLTTINAVGAGQNPVPASATVTITTISSASTAGQSNPASVVRTITSLSAVATGQNPVPASAAVTLSTVSSASTAVQSNPVSAANTLTTITAVATGQNPVPASAAVTITTISSASTAGQSNLASTARTITTISAVATGQNPVPASATVTIATISSASSAGQSNPVSATNTLTTINAVGTGQNPVPASATATLSTISTVANAGQSNLASTARTITILSVVSTGQNPVPASATVTISTISAVGSATSTSAGNGLATLTTISAVAAGQNPVPASAAVTITTLSSVANAGQRNPVSAAVTLTALSATGNATSATNASGLSTLTIVSATGIAGQSIAVTGLATITVLSAVGTGQIPRTAVGLSSIGTMSAAGTAQQVVPASALATITTISAVAAMTSATNASAVIAVPTLRATATGQIPVIATGLATLTTVSGFGTAISGSNATGLATLTTISAVAAGQNPVPASAAVTITSLSTVGSGQIPRAVVGNATLTSVSAVGIAGQSDRFSAVASLGTMSAAGTVQNPITAAGLATITVLSAIGLFGQVVSANATVTVTTISASGQVSAGSNCSAIVNLPTLRATASASQIITASATVNLPTLQATAQAVREIVASAVTSITTLSALGTFKQETFASGLSDIVLTARGLIVQGTNGAGIANIPTLSVHSQAYQVQLGIVSRKRVIVLARESRELLLP